MSSTGSMKTKPLLYKQLTLESDPEVIYLVESLVDEISSELGFKEDVYGNVMVAVTEAVNNCIFHGNKEDKSKKVFLDFEMENSYRLLVRVRDEGPGFDPAALPDPTSPAYVEEVGGRGVFLMHQLADELSFRQDGKEVEMMFNI